MRSFIAIDLRKKIKERILEESKELKNIKADLKFVEKENIHLTLKFLGEIDKEQEKKIKEKLEKILVDFDKFNLSLKGGGVFPSFDYIKVIWIGVEKGSKNVKNLNEEIRKALRGVEIKKSHHEYTPHVTIARVKSGKGKGKITRFVKGLKGKEFGTQKVKKIHLKKSELTKKGPIYSDLEVFEL